MGSRHGRAPAGAARAALLALGVLAIRPQHAGAQTEDAGDPRPPLIAFHAAAPPGPLADQAREALGRAAEQRGTALIDLSPPTPLPPEAPRHLARAIEAYHNIAYPDALASADAGLLEAAASGARGLAPSQLGDLYLYRALAATELGDGARAWEDFVRAATVNPVRTLDPVRFAPRVIETFQRALAEVARLPRVSATLDAPATCARWLDGRQLTEARLTAPRGDHVVRVECPGREPWGAALALSADGQVVHPTRVDLRPPGPASIAATASERGFREAVLAEVTGAPAGMALLALSRIDQRGHVLSRVTVSLRPADAAGAAVAALTRLLGAGAVTRTVVAERPWYRSPFVWGGVAVGAALATAVLLPFALTGDDAATGFDVDLGPLP